MPNAQRRKGVEGEREVRDLWERHGFTVRGLEGAGDHAVFVPHFNHDKAHYTRMENLHSEVKRCETARPWAWMTQAEREAPPGAVPVVAFRRSRSPWYAILPLNDLARLLS